jgi:Mechanosensitive ion channel
MRADDEPQDQPGGQPGEPDMLELSVEVARKVRARARPWRAIIALVLAIGAVVANSWARSHFHAFFEDDQGLNQVVAAATAIAFCFFGSVATIGLSGQAKSTLEPVMGVSHAAVVRYSLVLIGAVTTLIVTLVLFGVPVGQLLLGGALTSVFVGIAAQQALSNVFAGLVLLLARPFKVGDEIRLRAGALSGEIEGTVSEIGITYVRLSSAAGLVSIPNSQVLNAVVAPVPPGGDPPPIAPVTTLAGAPAPAAVAVASGPAGAVHDGPDGASAGPVGTADGGGGAPRPGSGGEQ